MSGDSAPSSALSLSLARDICTQTDRHLSGIDRQRAREGGIHIRTHEGCGQMRAAANLDVGRMYRGAWGVSVDFSVIVWFFLRS